MAFNPFQEKGIPLEQQVHSWTSLDVEPYDKNAVDPYTRCRVILMNGIEVEAAIFKHEFSRMCPDMELKKSIAFTRRLEQQQQKIINWLIPADESAIENTIGYEQLAVDLTAGLAKLLSNTYSKQVFDFGLLEDFDHLYRYANLLDLIQGKDANDIVQGQTEITLGRPTIAEHRHPFDSIRNFSDMKTSQPLDLLCILTLVSAEQQTMNFYMNTGNRASDATARGLYQEIGMVEEQHVSQYENLMDPRASWFEMLVLHEYNECWLYHSLMEQEVDSKIRKIWEMCLSMELQHLRIASECLQKYENKDARDMCPQMLPDPIVLRSNIDYVRNILATQVKLTADGPNIVPVDQLPGDSRYSWYQRTVNDAFVPSQNIIQRRINDRGEDYRLELSGPHPVESFRDRKRVAMSETCILEGMEVADHQGKSIGQIKEMYFNEFLLNRRLKADLYVPLNAIEKVAKEIQLKINEEEIENMGWRKSA
ncbi:MAG: hypothetical protein A4E57_01723 [Syntrophorhabdaceae bacterium PtaU1.Bin034]|nr:MAG: hypothetical protein A4E57_01723 [Syntrophorhabdaceae bacterium PtaU1.Bin034]